METEAKKLDELEKEIESLKALMLFREDTLLEKKQLVSLRNMSRLLVSEKDLEKAIDRAKKSLFAGAEDAVS
ncbi:MAG: hypothetical protein SVE93_06050 [Candidatus Thermoplasmatota archaeon]|nr:hypothetical protein [Candidatus Thermoplasmatota archaeon]